MARIVATTYKQLLDARNTSFKLARVLQALSDGTLTHGSTMSAQSAAHVDALILQHSNSMNVAGLFADKAATLGLNFWSSTYFTRSSSFGVVQGANFEDLVTFNRATAGGFINELGVYALAPADTPRLSHDPSSVVLSTSIVDLSTEVPTFALEAHTFIAGDQFRATANVGYVCGVVLSTTANSVTIQAQNVVGVGVGSSWVCIKPLGLLVEEQRTNLLLQSSAVNTASWAKAAISAVSSGTSPDGIPAEKITPTAGAGNHYYGQASAFTGAVDNGVFSLSLRIKADGYNHFHIQGKTKSGLYPAANVDLSAGTITLLNSSGGETASISPLPDGWYLCSLSWSVLTGAQPLSMFLTPKPTGANSVSFTADGVSGALVAGHMTEAATSPSSYIPTEATQVTRAADLAAVNTLSPWYNPLEGTLVIVANTGAGATPHYASFLTSTGSSYEGLRAFRQTSIGTDRLAFRDAGGPDVIINSADITSKKRAVSYKAGGDVAICADGGAVSKASIAAESTPAITRLFIGSRNGGELFLNGIIQSITYYPRVIDVQQASA